MTAKKKFKKRIFILLLPAAVFCALAFYLGSFYHASGDAVRAAQTAETVTAENGRKMLLFLPEDAVSGYDSAVIFYPGGKVQYEAYAPLCRELADRGIPCVLTEMPFHLAILDTDAAGEAVSLLKNRYGCSHLYIGGHSLGGVMASAFAYSHPDTFDGIFFLAAYPNKDLSGTDLGALSIYGSEDGILTPESYSGALAFMPADFTECVLTGGCHSFFGDYGLQNGDGTPGISREEQIRQTADRITAWMQNTSYRG